MRSLLVWLGVSALVGTSYGIACAFARDPGAAPWLAVTAVVATAAVLVAVGVGLARSVCGRAGGAALVVAILGLAVARGVLVGSRPRGQLPRVVTRGHPPQLRYLTATHPSWPGPRCVVDVSDEVGGQFRVMVTTPACTFGPGDQIAVVSSSMAASLVSRRGSGPLMVDGPVWVHARAQTVSAKAGREVAEQREAAWNAARGRPGLGFVAASTLGMVVALPPADRDRLRASGLGHLIAVSGLHVGLAAMVVLRTLGRILARFRWGPAASLLLTWLPVILYVWMTGAGAPAVRAATMLLVVSVGDLVGRPTHGLTTVALAAALMLLYEPASCADPGFQMSMFAMAVLVRTPPEAGLIAVSWRLGWAVMPIAWAHFGRVDGYGVFANAIAVPVFVGWVVPTAMVGAAASVWVGQIAWWPSAAGAELILAVATWVASWPAAPPWAWVVVAAGALVVRLRWHGPRAAAWLPPRLACVGMIAVFVGRTTSRPPPHPPGWVAEGPMVVVFEGAKACIRDPRGAAARWPSRVQEWGVARVSVDAARGTSDAPDLVAIRRALARTVVIDTADCTFPGRRHVRKALHQCQKSGGVRVQASQTDGLQCQLFGGWFPLRLDSSSS